MTRKQRPPIGDLLKKPPVVNPSAVRADDPVAPKAPVETVPAPAEEPVNTQTAHAAPVEEVPPAKPEAKPEPAQVQAQEVAEAGADQANTAEMLFGAPVHRRSVKQKSSQLSVMVNAELYRIVSSARVEVPGLTGQTILTEGIIMWLIYNNFIDKEKGAELLRAHQQI